MNDTGVYMKTSAPKAHIYDLGNYLQRVVFCSIDYISMPWLQSQTLHIRRGDLIFCNLQGIPIETAFQMPLIF